MAYWFKAGVNPGSSKQFEYIMDSDNDLTDLPNTSADGTSQGDDITHLKCEKGSTAFSIDSGNVYVLNSSDEWTNVGRLYYAEAESEETP